MAARSGQGWPSSGWAKNSGISLSTLDRVDDSLLAPPCIPWIGSGWADDCDVRESTNSWICCGVEIRPPVITPVIPDPGGRGSGPTTGIKGYDQQHQDALLETRRKRILAEDEDVVALIMAMVTRDLL